MNVNYNIADYLQRSHEPVTGRWIDHISERYDSSQTEALRLQEDLAKLLAEQSEREKSVSSWSSWNMWLNNLNIALSGTAGAVLIGTGNVAPGIAVAAPAVLSLTNRMVADLGGHKALAAWVTESKEQQKKIAADLEFGVSLFSTLSGLATGYGARAFLVPRENEILQAITAIVQRTLPVANGLTKVGQAKAEKGVAELQQIQGITKGQTDYLNGLSASDIEQTEKMIESREVAVRIARKAIESENT